MNQMNGYHMPKKHPISPSITAQQAKKFIDIIRMSLSYLFLSKDSIQTIVNSDMKDILADIKFYLEDK